MIDAQKSSGSHQNGEGGLKRHFGYNLAQLLATKLEQASPDFKVQPYLAQASQITWPELELKARTTAHAHLLAQYLPPDYPAALNVLTRIMGPENPKETGMFTNWYWLGPVSTFILHYGPQHPAHFEASLRAIAELTKRNTGEYAIRPFIEAWPQATLTQLQEWAHSDNFHLRRLASEGLRPRLPWAPKLSVFIADPAPVLPILETLRDDPVKFVQKSVANHLNDYLKDNPDWAWQVLETWGASPDITPARRWIIKHALRNELKRDNTRAHELLKMAE